MSLRRKNSLCVANRLRRGAAVVEFAIVTPLFLLLLAGIIEFGQAFQIEHALSTASRRGARAAAMEAADNAPVEQMVRAHCAQTLGVNPNDVAVSIAVNGDAAGVLGNAESGDEICVTVSVPYSQVGSGFYVNRFFHSTLSSQCTLERE
jgi:Flp pilus assembly protein TadG